MSDQDLVAQHWPHIAALAAALNGLPSTVTIQAEQDAPSSHKLTDDEINAIHEGLLRKQHRGGSLGLNR
jgi:hypothetical protein